MTAYAIEKSPAAGYRQPDKHVLVFCNADWLSVSVSLLYVVLRIQRNRNGVTATWNFVPKNITIFPI